MNHTSLLDAILKKYSDQPTVQSDIRRALRYAESHSRMFLAPFIKGKTPQLANEIQDLVDSVEDTHAEIVERVISKTLLAAAPGETRAAHLKELRAALVEAKAAGPEVYAAASKAADLSIELLGERLVV